MNTCSWPECESRAEQWRLEVNGYVTFVAWYCLEHYLSMEAVAS
jgi:hypothetical protein